MLNTKVKAHWLILSIVLIALASTSGGLKAHHKDIDLLCELESGVSGSGAGPCCDVYALSGGGSGAVYEWFELPTNQKGYFEPDLTIVQHTNYHCNVTSFGSPSLYLDVDGGVLEGHGTGLGSCSGSPF